MNIIVNYNDKRWRGHNIDFDKISKQFVGDGEVSVVLTNDFEIRKLNKQYRKIDKATNVLSFETGDDVLLGDIYISYDTVEKESKDIGFINHTNHMVVHGILHLLGYDHINDSDADKMESAEIAVLKKLEIKNPYKANRKQFAVNKNNLLFVLCSLLCGGIAALGFAPFNLLALTLIGIGGMYYMATSSFVPRLSFFAFGFAYGVASFWWVLNSIYVVQELAQQFAIWTVPGLFGLGMIGAIIFAIPFLSIRCIRTIPAYRPILFATIWTIVLWLREWFLTGFPWNPIANITIPFPIISNSMSLWGALGLTFVFVGLAASVVEAVKKRYFALIIFLILLIIGCVFGYSNIKKSAIRNSHSEIIRIVQPARSASDKATHNQNDAIANAEANIKHLVDLAKLDDIHPDLIVFPETAYPYLIVDNQIPFTDKFDIPVIIGAMSYKNGSYYNSMVVARDGFVEHLYSKSHLVPFGEYRPFGDLIPTPGQLTPGGGAEKISVDGFNFVPAICYEIIFSDSLVASHNDKPTDNEFILNITNDTWFGKTPGTYQHLDMVRRYAIESGLPIVRANYSGVSAFVGSDGKIISFLPVGVAGVLDGTVYGAHKTIYRAIGRDGWMIIILMFSIICLIYICGFRTKD